MEEPTTIAIPSSYTAPEETTSSETTSSETTSGDPALQIFREFVRLTEAIAAAEEQTEDLKQQRSILERQILERFTEHGISHIAIDGKVVYLARDVRIGKEDRPLEEIIAALQQTKGLEDYAKPTVNVQGLGSLARELEQEDEMDRQAGDAPVDIERSFFARYPQLKGLLRFHVGYRVKARKASKR